MKTKIISGLLLVLMLSMPIIVSSQSSTTADTDQKLEVSQSFDGEIPIFQQYDGDETEDNCEWVLINGRWQYICP